MMGKFLALFLAGIVLTNCASLTPANQVGIAKEIAVRKPSLEKIADGVWIHMSYETIEPWGPILSQGLVVKTDGGVFLIDTAWNDADTEEILALIEAETGELPKAAIVTHAHQDKMGGMRALHDAGIQTWAYEFTNEDAPGRNLIIAENAFENPITGSASDFKFEDIIYGAQKMNGLMIFAPGPGHTRDNIVVYYEPANVLFGGCLIRPRKSSNLGNTADGDIGNWANAVHSVAAEFPDAEIIIPSHGPVGGRELFDHTVALAVAANE